LKIYSSPILQEIEVPGLPGGTNTLP